MYENYDLCEMFCLGHTCTMQGLTNIFLGYLPKDRLERENYLPYRKTYLHYLNKDKRYYWF